MQRINQKIKEIFESNALAVATVSGSGSPHCIAVGFAKFVSDEELLITDNFMSETVENIQNNSSVAIAGWSRNWEDDCEGYEIKGKAEYFQEGEFLEKAKGMAENEGMPCKGVIIVKINSIKKLA